MMCLLGFYHSAICADSRVVKGVSFMSSLLTVTPSLRRWLLKLPVRTVRERQPMPIALDCLFICVYSARKSIKSTAFPVLAHNFWQECFVEI